MTAKEYYKSTRMVETRQWTLEMALNFAEEYAEALRKPTVIGSVCSCGNDHSWIPKTVRHCYLCKDCGKPLEQTVL